MSKLIKQRAKCCKFVLSDGGVRHYVFVGGCWYYNGRSSLPLHECQAMKDGFWLDSLQYKLFSFGLRFREMVSDAHAANLGEKPKLVGPYIREWMPTGDR
ncbi:hypothetical protein Erwinia_phage_Berlingot_00001 [Erwinia phage Berlingot]|nr:hypothetical protein Erwinia_phage_Berlingot_00001 [Erwinia phage Berlingot]